MDAPTPNIPSPPRRLCVQCSHARMNRPANLPMLCAHPRSEMDPLYGAQMTCAMMRAPGGPCGLPGYLFECRAPQPAKVSLARRFLTWLTGGLS